MKRLFCLILSLTFAFPSNSYAKTSGEETVICTTIYPLKALVEDFVARACPEKKVSVYSVVPPDSNPHYFEPKLSTRQSLQSANIWIRCSEPIEEQIKKAIHPQLTIDLKEHITPLSTGCCHSHHFDTHFWLSIENLKTICQVLYKQIADHLLLPEELATALIEQDTAKIETIASQLRKDLPQKTILTNHPILNYLCKDLGLHTQTTEPSSGSLTLAQSEKLSLITREEAINSLVIILPYSQTLAKKFASQHQLELKIFSPYNKSPIEALSEFHHLLKQ